MPELIAEIYYNQLAAADPSAICRNGRCQYEKQTGCYRLKIWGMEWVIEPREKRISFSLAGGPVHEYFGLFAVYYLLQGKDTPPRGAWISEKDLPGGPTFFRGPHLIPTDLISRRFGDDLAAFRAVCEALGGEPLAMADAAYTFTITADLPLAVLYWAGDEEFPAEARLLYNRSIGEILSLDILFALAVAVCDRLGTAAE
jgi:hypothetical protein